MQVQRCYTDLLESGGHGGGPLAPKTVRHAHVVLRKSLADAADGAGHPQRSSGNTPADR